jgi:hypothetical protein
MRRKTDRARSTGGGENGLPSGDGSQLDSATPGMGFGPIASFSEPSVSFRSGEKLLMLNLFSGLGTTR